MSEANVIMPAFDLQAAARDLNLVLISDKKDGTKLYFTGIFMTRLQAFLQEQAQ